MLRLFRTDDGNLHQADLFLDGTVIVRLMVEKMIPRRGRAAKWDWMVWAASGPWSEPDVGWYGEAPSLNAAKLEALDALIADMTPNEAESPPAPTAVSVCWTNDSLITVQH